MVDGTDLRMHRRELVGDSRRLVLRAVVDDDDLEGVGDRREHLERFVNEAADVGLFVVGRKEVGQASQTLGHGRAST